MLYSYYNYMKGKVANASAAERLRPMTPEEMERAFPGAKFPTISAPIRKTRTLYVREEDQEIWDQAKELVGESLSTFVTAQLRSLVAEKRAARQGVEQIVVKFSEERIPRAKAFLGRWIIPPEAPFENDEIFLENRPDLYALAVTAKNNIVVFNFWGARYDPEKFLPGYLHVFETVKDAASFPRMPDGLGVEIMKRLGVEIEVLDI